MIASGTADCLTPKPSPRRSGGSARAIARLAVVWQAALPSPRAAMHTSSEAGPSTAVAIATPPATTSAAATRRPLRRPIRSKSSPAVTAPTAAEPKNTLTPAPRAASPIPRSARTHTACAPSRNGGSAPRVVSPEAPSIMRAPARCSSCRPGTLTRSRVGQSGRLAEGS